MQENEFEKQVQAKLDEFQLSPSASVWKNVEKQIREKKRRRIIFFFILPVALGLIGFSLYQYIYTGNETAEVRPVAIKVGSSLQTDPKTIDLETKKPPVVKKQEEIITSDPLHNESFSQNKKQRNTSTGIPGNSVSSLPRPVNKRTTTIINDVVSKTRENDVASSPNNSDKSGQPAKTIIDDKPIDDKTVDATATKPAVPVQADKLAMDDKSIVSVQTDSLQIPVDAPITSSDEVGKKKTASTGIKWGIEFSAGLAGNHSSQFSLKSNYRADMTANPSTGGASGSVTSSPIRSGPAFNAGLIGEVQVSKKSRISSGLQYSYASNRIKTGSRVDTSVSLVLNNFSSTQVDAVYRGPQQNSYTNSYHFITIPLWYHWQINKQGKKPVQWNIGIDASYMIATNALVYNSSYGGIYYRDKDAFTKMHFNLGTGISFRLGKPTKKEWVIGPELGFDMNRLLKDNDKQYLLYGGINVKLFLPKRKNK